MEEKNDLYFMKQAYQEALKAFAKEEVPVGAVLVYENQIIARGHNQVELLKDATAHAEMLCLTSGSAHLGNWRLEKTTLYCTLEPCCMCAGAMYLSRIQRLVYGAKDLRVGANGSWFNLFDQDHPIHTIEVEGGIYAEPCSALIQEFFQKQRNKYGKKITATSR